MAAAIVVENVSKKYRLVRSGEERLPYRTLRDEMVRWAGWPVRYLRGQTSKAEDFWALKDVSFEVQPGEVVGVIGRNGAGKSTLLKVLSRITKPTSGRVRLRGRVGSLLEVGTGFHPELTGRENIYLSGAVLGMRRAEIRRKFDEIVAFAEVEKFLDLPVKRYSSGMYMRLAFAVAAHLEPEILLVDEVLAVGDAAFQKKCLGKMGEVAKGGRTVIFVSHNMGAVQQLCSRGVLLSSGSVVTWGEVDSCLSDYLSCATRDSLIVSHIKHCDSWVHIERVTVCGSEFDDITLPANATELPIVITGSIDRPLAIDLEVWFRDQYDTPLAFFSLGHDRGVVDTLPAGRFYLSRIINLPRLLKGNYRLDLFLTEPNIREHASLPSSVALNAEGSTTSTGMAFEYNHGRGWILLS